MIELVITSVFLSSLILNYLLSKYPIKLFLDNPGGRKIHKEAKPRVGGIALYISLTFGIFQLGIYQDYIQFLFFSLSAFFAIGLIDDLYSLRSLPKFSFPFITSVIIAYQYSSFFLDSHNWLLILLITFWTFFNPLINKVPIIR